MMQRLVRTLVLLAAVCLLLLHRQAGATALDEDVETGSLQLAIIVHRHGDRTPVLIPEGEEQRWPLGPGQLTGLGVHQLWELGEEIRGLLDGFLDTSYAPSVAYSRASNKDRTLQSAEAMLMALFPLGTGPTYPFEEEEDEQEPALPRSFQPVPTHSVELERDHVLRGYQNCPRYDQYLLETFYDAPAGVEATASHRELLDTLSDVFEADVTLKNLNLYYDYLWCLNKHSMQDFVSEEVYEQTVDLYDWVYSQDFMPSNESSLIGGPLMGQILADMQALISGDDSTKLKLYSAHDVTLGTLRAVMGLESPIVPPYASWAMFELHRIAGEWRVKFTYNGELEELHFCSGEQEGVYCPLGNYESTFSLLVPEDPEAACSLAGEQEDDEHEDASQTDGGQQLLPFISNPLLLAVLAVTVGLLVAVVGILVGYIFVLRKDRFVIVQGKAQEHTEPIVEVELSEMKPDAEDTV